MKIQFKQNGGGMPPLTYYTALSIPQAQSTDITAESGSKDDDMSLKNIFDYVKGLSGLPSDIDYFTKQISSFFSNPFNQENTSAMSAMYLNLINKANLFKFSKEQFDNSKTQIINKGGLNEIAINPYGYVYVKDSNGETSLVSPEDFYQNRSLYVPITNDDLLNMRAYDAPMSDEILTTINNGTGMKEITSRINEMINTLGTTEYKESNLTRGEKNGFVLLFNLASRSGIQPANIEGLFKSELITKEQEPQIMSALRYVYTNLTPSEQALLKTKTGSDRDAMLYIYDLYNAKSNTNISITNEPYAAKTGSGDGSGNDSDLKSNPLVRIILGEGGENGKYTVVRSDGDQGFTIDATHYGKVPGINKNCNLDEFLTKSGIDQFMIKRGMDITFGDQDLDILDLQDVMYDNKGISTVPLPAITQFDGSKKVNFAILDQYKEACRQFKQETGLNNFQFIKTEEQLNKWIEILKRNDLYAYANKTIDGKFDSSLFGTFLVVDAYTTDKNKKYDKNSKYIEKVTDRSEIKRLYDYMVQGLSTNSESQQDNKNKYNYKFDPGDKGIFEGFRDNIYKGTVFIPVHNNISAAYYDSYQPTMQQVNGLESMYQQYQKRANQNSNSSDLLSQ